jgi:general secretion pathway protein C
MVSNLRNSWAVAATTFLLWGLVAASAVYGGLKFAAKPGGAPGGPPVVAPMVTADPAAIAALLGAVANSGAAPVASLSSRFALIGVVADQSHSGAALIAVDGKPPKPFRVGANVDENLVLQSVDSRRAVLGAGSGGAPVLTLELPPPRH